MGACLLITVAFKYGLSPTSFDDIDCGDFSFCVLLVLLYVLGKARLGGKARRLSGAASCLEVSYLDAPPYTTSGSPRRWEVAINEHRNVEERKWEKGKSTQRI